MLAGNPTQGGFAGAGIWRQAGGVKGEVSRNCSSATLYTSGQLSPMVMLFQLWGAVGLGILDCIFQFPQTSQIYGTGFPCTLYLAKWRGPCSSKFFRFPCWKWSTVQKKSSDSGEIHHKESWASLNMAMQMHIFKETLHQSSRIIAAEWNFSCFIALVQQHYNFTLSRLQIPIFIKCWCNFRFL